MVPVTEEPSVTISPAALIVLSAAPEAAEAEDSMVPETDDSEDEAKMIPKNKKD